MCAAALARPKAPRQLPGVSTLSTGSASHDVGFRPSVTQETALPAWPTCPEENSLSGQGWGPAGLRGLQKLFWEESSAECGGGPWARCLDSGQEEAGLGGLDGWYS